MKHHHFGVELATKISIPAAIIFNHVAFYSLRNFENGGLQQFVTTAAGLAGIYPYLSVGIIRKALHQLEDNGLIVNRGRVVTYYGYGTVYSLTSEGLSLCDE